MHYVAPEHRGNSRHCIDMFRRKNIVRPIFLLLDREI